MVELLTSKKRLSSAAMRDYIIRAHGMATGLTVQSAAEMRKRIGELLEIAITRDSVMEGFLGRGGAAGDRDILGGSGSLEDLPDETAALPLNVTRYKVQQDKGVYCLKGCADGDLVDYSAYEALLRRLDTSEESSPCVSHVALKEYEREITAMLDVLGPEAIRVREGAGAENLLQSLAVTLANLRRAEKTTAVNPTHQHADGCPKLYGGDCACNPVPL